MHCVVQKICLINGGTGKFSVWHWSTGHALLVYDLPLYLICPKVLSIVAELLLGYGWVSSKLICFSLFVYLFVSEVTLIQLSKQKPYCNKREENDRRFPPEIITFVIMVTTLYTNSLAPLSYSTASVSLPVPLSVASRLSRSTISVSSGFPYGS